MKKLFFCPDCNLKFTAEGKLKKWQDKIFGPCRKWVARCPVCKKEADEENLKEGRKNRRIYLPKGKPNFSRRRWKSSPNS